MSNFKRTITTQKGHALMAKMLTGVTVEFTRITTSEHDYYMLEDFELEALAGVENEKQSVLVSDVELTNESYSRVHSVITNTELTEGYYVKAICLYANDPDEGEILYSITVCESGKADWLPPFNTHNVSSIEVNLDTVISNAKNVSLEVNPAALISVKTFNKFKDDVASQLNNTAQQIETVNSNIYNLDSNKAEKAELQSETANRKQEIAVERARIDSFAKLTEGSTTGDAELIDSRVGVDGKTYNNLGDAIREQIGSINKDLDYHFTIDETINIIPINLRWEKGFIDSNTGENTNSGFTNSRTDKIKIKNTGYLSTFWNTDIALGLYIYQYKNDGTFISRDSATDKKHIFTINTDCAYIRFGTYKSSATSVIDLSDNIVAIESNNIIQENTRTKYYTNSSSNYLNYVSKKATIKETQSDRIVLNLIQCNKGDKVGFNGLQFDGAIYDFTGKKILVNSIANEGWLTEIYTINYDGFILLKVLENDSANVLKRFYYQSNKDIISKENIDNNVYEQTKDYLIKNNWIDNLALPDYYFKDNYIDNKIKEIEDILQYSVGNGDAFYFIADMHWQYNAYQSPKLINYISKKINISKLFNGGDNADGYYNYVPSILRRAFSGDIYTACGNHEYMKHTDNNQIYYQFNMYNKDAIFGDKGRNYFYVDNKQQNIRYIVLNAWKKQVDSAGDYDSCENGYEQEQLNWLKNAALNVGSGWTIIVVTHSIYDIERVTRKLSISPKNSNDLITILDEYNGNGTIACVIQGHSHGDRITHTPGGIPIIITTCDKNKPYIYEDTSDLDFTRNDGTIEENAFDVVIINKTLKKISFVRVGAHALDGVDDNVGEPTQIREVFYN